MDKIDYKISKIQDVVLKDLTPVEKYKQVSTLLFEKEGKKTMIQQWQIDWMKELRSHGRSYEDIAKILGLSLSSVRYYLVAGEKDKMKKANEKSRERMKSNPAVWKAYVDYQREYQRNLAKKRKAEETEKTGVSNSSASPPAASTIENPIITLEPVNETQTQNENQNPNENN